MHSLLKFPKDKLKILLNGTIRKLSKLLRKLKFVEVRNLMKLHYKLLIYFVYLCIWMEDKDNFQKQTQKQNMQHLKLLG